MAALCPGCKAKGAAANFVWLFEHPDSSAYAPESFSYPGSGPAQARAGVILVSDMKGGMEMPANAFEPSEIEPSKFEAGDFQPPRSLKESLQRFSLELDCMMVWLRNEARYHDAMDSNVLDNAHLLANLLADSYREAETLLPELERRVTGADLGVGSRE